MPPAIESRKGTDCQPQADQKQRDTEKQVCVGSLRSVPVVALRVAHPAIVAAVARGREGRKSPRPKLRFRLGAFFFVTALERTEKTEAKTEVSIASVIPSADAIDSFNPEPSATALVDSTVRLAVGSGLNNL